MNINRYHFYFWVGFFSVAMLLDYLMSPSDFKIVRHLYIPVVELSIFYGFLFVLVQFKKGGIIAWVKNVALFSLSFMLVLFLNHIRGKIAIYYNDNMFQSFRDLIYNTIYIYLSISVYTIGYYYLNRSNRKEKELRLLAEVKATQDIAHAKLRQDMLELENNFLRAQINPHFLYNTLNVFYAQAQPLSEALSNNILTLSKIMRYSLETTQGGHLVPLEMEVAHLKRVIGIHQLRFDNQLPIKLTVEEPLGEVKVVPLIFITLLENALKHGETNDPDNPIALWLAVDASRIYFTIRNKIADRPRDQSFGIGMENIKKRLNAVYGDRHQFGIDDKDGIYHVVLAVEHGNNE